MIRDEAQALAIALRNNFAEVRDAVDMLVEIPGTPDHVFVMDLLVQLLHRTMNAGKEEDVARGLYHMAIAGNITDADLRKVALWAFDALHLADARIMADREDVIDKMRNALAIAAERAKAGGHQWQFL